MARMRRRAARAARTPYRISNLGPLAGAGVGDSSTPVPALTEESTSTKVTRLIPSCADKNSSFFMWSLENSEDLCFNTIWSAINEKCQLTFDNDTCTITVVCLTTGKTLENEIIGLCRNSRGGKLTLENNVSMMRMTLLYKEFRQNSITECSLKGRNDIKRCSASIRFEFISKSDNNLRVSE